MQKIKSFVRRGRVRTQQQHALDNLSANFLVKQPYYWTNLFANDNPIILEIGFGNGKSLVQMASENPHLNYLGIEVHLAGVGTLVNDAYNLRLANLKVINDDATEVLKLMPDDFLAGLQLYFPDPWHKKKHNKRRIVNAEFLQLLLSKLQNNAIIHMATDWQDYANQMLEVLTTNPQLQNLWDDFANNISRPLTKFEERGQKLGHGVWDLQFSVVK
jgi:tRNA (guanine-N7-)-methyltransferase